MHVEEPKCAVKEAVENGNMVVSRYESYVQIIKGDEDNYRQDKHQIQP
jgi:ribosome biogenesis GTPase